ncbi:MAG TPA: DUF559 domain-containing protein [Ohtaekwangia sp.]|nr:DUF559 domain-containing protein [Ohtaekwangia sp.]
MTTNSDTLVRLKVDFADLEKITDKWGYFRQIYMEMIPLILERAEKDVITPVNPYPVDWGSFMSPIEFSAWCSIRSHYMALYPQFPLFNYFIDFANPYLRIGLEMDGKDYHNAEKDRSRDEMLLRYGWKIFRIPGRECFVEYQSYDLVSLMEDEEEKAEALRHWILNTSDGVIYALKKVYFERAEHHKLYPEFIETLTNHRGSEFEVE